MSPACRAVASEDSVLSMMLPSVRTWASIGSILSALSEPGAFGKAIARRVKRSPNLPDVSAIDEMAVEGRMTTAVFGLS